MKEKTGQIFSITKDNPTVAGCTVSKSIYSAKGYDFTYFSLAECTDISAETYEYPKICIVEALIFALDGNGIIGYEGQEHKIKAGENFKFAKNGKHYVKADGKFKMALLLTLE